MNCISNRVLHITSNRQKQNGTFAVMCLITGAIYTSHANGYVRRDTFNANGKRIQYQLNPVCKVTGKRIMLNENDRMIKILDSIDSYIVTKYNRNNK